MDFYNYLMTDSAHKSSRAQVSEMRLDRDPLQDLYINGFRMIVYQVVWKITPAIMQG